MQASFNEVNQAQQERERMINEANGEYNKEVPVHVELQTKKYKLQKDMH